MEISPFYPLQDDSEKFQRFCKLPLHVGTATVQSQRAVNHPLAYMFERFRPGSGVKEPDSVAFHASFIFPAAGDCLVFLRSEDGIALNRDFGENLFITGDSDDGPFRFDCPSFYVNATSHRETPSWSIAVPHGFATITYGPPRACRRVVAVINNFDFESGNAKVENTPSPNQEIPRLLRVVAAGRNIDFVWRPDHQQILRLLSLEIMRSAALTTFSFEARNGESEGELIELADNIAGLWRYAA